MGHLTVLDQWGGVVCDNSISMDNRLSSAGLLTGQWWRRKGSVRVRNKKFDMFVLTLIKLQIREEAPCRL